MAKSNKTGMTETERLELAKKLDEDLDNYINSLEKREYTEGWPVDRWEEEMEKHPFFMKSAPKEGDELSPLMQGLQQLKYDPDENTPEELANAYKDDGNFNFKHKNYRLAVIAYTEGIKIKCEDKDIQATLYNNRSAAHYFLQNYRSSLKDAELALALKPDYEKASIRAAHCCYEMELYDDAIKRCDNLLIKLGTNEELVKLRLQSLQSQKLKEKDSRKRQLNQSKRKQEDQKLIDTILSRGVCIDCQKLEDLVPPIPQLSSNRVRLDEDGKLVWPVTLLYPEYQIFEFIQEFHEESSFQAHLNEIFQESCEWDKDNKYSSTNVNVYIELNNAKLHNIDITKKLSEILKLPGCIIKNGTPSFIIVPAASDFGKHFLKQYVLEQF